MALLVRGGKTGMGEVVYCQAFCYNTDLLAAQNGWSRGVSRAAVLGWWMGDKGPAQARG